MFFKNIDLVFQYIVFELLPSSDGDRFGRSGSAIERDRYYISMAIRIGEVNDSMLRVHQIGVTRRVTVAAGDYFRDCPEPKTPEDLVDRNCIVYGYQTMI